MERITEIVIVYLINQQSTRLSLLTRYYLIVYLNLSHWASLAREVNVSNPMRGKGRKRVSILQ